VVIRLVFHEDAMKSLYNELSEKIEQNPRLTKRGGARADLGLLLFNTRDSLRDLWEAAEHEVTESGGKGHQTSETLKAAVEKLRPLFGERKE
jgi:hypothetical protein